MHDDELKNLLNNLEQEQTEQEQEEAAPIERPETTIEAEPIPVIIDIGFYTSPLHFGKRSETDNETLQFYINTASIELNRLSVSEHGTIFERWNIVEGEKGFITKEQRSHLRRAVALTTSVFEDADYDRTKGSFSLSLPGMSVSQSTNDNNIIIPPVVLSELIAAGFYQAPISRPIYETQFLNGFDLEGNVEMNEYLTYETADGRYLRQLQDNVENEWIATIENNKIVFKPLSDQVHKIKVDEAAHADLSTKADQVLDTQTGTYQNLKRINDILFLGPAQTDGMTRNQIYNAIAAVNVEWQPDIKYRRGALVYKSIGKLVHLYKSLVDDNLGNDPEASEFAWEKLNTQPIDVNTIIADTVNQTKAYVDMTTPELVKNEVNTKINELPTIDYVDTIYKKGISIFETKNDFDSFKTEYQEQTGIELLENTDYQVLSLNEVVGTGENGEFIENKLRQSDLPNLNYNITAGNAYGANTPDHWYTSTPNVVKMSNGRGANRAIGSFNSSYQTFVSSATIYLNGNAEQTSHQTSYRQYYFVKFLRDITITKKGAVKPAEIMDYIKKLEERISALENKK